ncbi:PE family protein [Mycobacterium sp.]|uniref:PE family protein n=1 Tax=Mycobacterium sp. TaxID=1785 RepID=UPI002BC310BA|nr:PE family protein [Mycobacterium sp.]HTQ22344.1 PE family protein [Mycobacterium sp.]
MSLLVADPELIETAAQNLAGIRATLGEATSSAAAPTTGVAAAAADEVSAAIAAVFGKHGQEFQALSAQASAFHGEFVNLLNGGAGAYLSTEIANAEQNLVGALGAPVAAIQSAVGSFAGGTTLGSLGSAASLLSGPSSGALASITGPYQTLFANTSANLQALVGAWAANPVPFWHQVALNQLGYASRIFGEIQTFFQNFPASVPALFQQAIASLQYLNPLPYLQWLVNSGQLTFTALQNIVGGIQAGLPALFTGFTDALRSLLMGDFSGAVNDIAQGFVNFLNLGVHADVTDNIEIIFNRFGIPTGVEGDLLATITPTGLVGDVFSAFAVPGQISQNFTNLLPPGSIPQAISQNFTNVVNTVTDTSIGADASLVARLLPLPIAVTSLEADLNLGLPLALAIDALGAPVVTVQALQSSISAFSSALQGGDFLGAIGALVDAPAVVTDGFLNGQAVLPLSLTVPTDVGDVALDVDLPLDGILVPLGPINGSVTLPLGLGTTDVVIGGTPLGGLIPGLTVWAPAQLADAIS